MLTFCQASGGWAEVEKRRSVAGEKRVRRRGGVSQVCHTPSRLLTTSSVSSRGACAARHSAQSKLKIMRLFKFQ